MAPRIITGMAYFRWWCFRGEGHGALEEIGVAGVRKGTPDS